MNGIRVYAGQNTRNLKLGDRLIELLRLRVPVASSGPGDPRMDLAITLIATLLLSRRS